MVGSSVIFLLYCRGCVCWFLLCACMFTSFRMLALLWGLQTHEQDKLLGEEYSCDSSWRPWQAKGTAAHQQAELPVTWSATQHRSGPGHTLNGAAGPRGVSLSPGQSHSPDTGDTESFSEKVNRSSILFPSRSGTVPRSNVRAIYLSIEYLLCVFIKSIHCVYFYDYPGY